VALLLLACKTANANNPVKKHQRSKQHCELTFAISLLNTKYRLRLQRGKRTFLRCKLDETWSKQETCCGIPFPALLSYASRQSL